MRPGDIPGRCRMACLVLLVGFAGTSWTGAAPPVEGRWIGAVSFRGDDWPVRLELRREGGALKGYLDLPDLVMAWEPVPISEGPLSVTVELPFGIGELDLSPGKDGLAASKQVGDETLSLILTQDTGAWPAREEVVFRSGDAILTGTLVSPPSAGRHPAIVLVQGSGSATREEWSYRSWADFYARHGVAALVYDRRGEGKSTGDPGIDRDFDVLAGDALAGVRLLKGRPDVDPASIGLEGGSQGGWIAPLAATTSSDVSFLVIASAPAVTPAEQEVERVVYHLRDDKAPESEILDAVSYLRLYFYVARTGKGWNLLEDETETAKAAPWGEKVSHPRRLEDLQWWKRHMDFDPAAILPKVSVPVLALYGSRDRYVPPVENAGKLEAYLRSGGNSDVTVRIFDEADHRLEMPMGKWKDGRWHWARIASLDTIGAWLAAHLPGLSGD